uniref:Uncharacterized protein n=1 Tax=Anguilla anguilla TaxID=7936 RepID=A0A0E9RIH1_ANGAN
MTGAEPREEPPQDRPIPVTPIRISRTIAQQKQNYISYRQKWANWHVIWPQSENTLLQTV